MKKLIALAFGFAGAAALAADYYVATTGNDENSGTSEQPLKTIAAAVTKANDAIDNGDSSATIHLATGQYVENGLSLSRPIRIVGEGATRDDVVINGNSSGRVFTLGNTDAVLENLTVKNGKYVTGSHQTSVSGANIYMSDGTVTNCVIKEGQGNGNDWNRGANIYMTGGTVADSLITGGKNATNGRGAVGYQIAATGGHVLRTEFKDGTYTSGNNGSICPVYLDGPVVFENCYLHNLECRQCTCNATPCTDDGHGVGYGVIYVNNANAKVINCTIVGNRAVNGSSHCAGIYLKAAGTVANCVLYKNLGTGSTDGAMQEWGNRNGGSFTYCAFGSGLGGYPSDASNLTTLTDDAFNNFGGGDLGPKVGSPLIDAGSNSTYTSAGATSETDLLGLPRFSPSANPIDIGAFERQAAGLAVVGNAAEYGFIGEATSFTAEESDAAGPVTYYWNFGDGSGQVATSEKSVSHTYAQRGFYTVTVQGNDGLTTSALYTLPSRIHAVPRNLYVATTGTDDDADGRGATSGSPYATIAYALSQLTTDSSPSLAGIDGVTIHLATGNYAERGITLAAGVRILGEGATRDDVSIDGGSSGRVIELAHADAVLENLTVKNGRTAKADISGANIYMTAGTVTNCVVTNGRGYDNAWNQGANIYMTDGTVVDSLITGGGNAMNGRAAVGYQIAATGGHVLRTEFKNGYYISDRQGSICPVYLAGPVVFENCYLHNLECRQCKCKGSYCDDSNHGVGLGTIYVNNANAKVINCTVVKNKAVNDASHCAGIYLNVSGTVANCVVYKNLGSADGDGAAQEWGNKNGGSFTYCAFGSGLGGYPSDASNVTTLTDDAFKDFANGDCHIAKAGAALKKAGCSWLDYLACGATSTTDLDGKVIRHGAHIDIGCYQFAARGLTVVFR